MNKTGAKVWGEYKSVDKFTFLRVYNAGHMVPMNQPEAALAMVDRFFGNWHRERMAKLAEEESNEGPITVELDLELLKEEQMMNLFTS